MITELTKEQIAAMPGHVERALKPFLTGAPIQKEQATRGFESLYAFCKLQKPKVMFVSSPMAAQYAAHMFKHLKLDKAQVRDQVWTQVMDQVEAQVWTQVRTQVRDQVGDQVRAQVRAQIRDRVGAQVGDQVWTQVGAQVRDQVRDQVRAQIRDRVGAQVWTQVGAQVGDQVEAQVGDQVGAQVRKENLEFVPFAFYGSGVYDASWIAYYGFFHEHGICKINHPQFFNLQSLLESNVFMSLQFANIVIGCEMPTHLERDEENRLHSTTGKAIEWSDGWGFHALWGVRFPEELWTSVVNKTIPPADILKLDNIEQRMAAMRFLGLDYIFDALPTKVLHKSERGNTLFSIDGLTDETEYALRYLCPSTQRQYVSFVPPEIGKSNDADTAMAWKHNMTKEMYHSMELES